MRGLITSSILNILFKMLMAIINMNSSNFRKHLQSHLKLKVSKLDREYLFEFNFDFQHSTCAKIQVSNIDFKINLLNIKLKKQNNFFNN